MSTGSNIEWTNCTCPFYNMNYGTNTRGRAEDRSSKSRSIDCRVFPPPRSRRQVVYQLQGVASAGLLRQGCHSLGWNGQRMRSVPKDEGEGRVCSTDATNQGAIICSPARRGRKTSASPNQLLRGVRAAAASKLADLCRLWTCVASGRAAS